MRIGALLAVAALAVTANQTLAQTPPVATPAAAAPAHYSVATTPIGTLLDDPAAKAILFKDIPAMASSSQLDMARGMTLKDTQQYAPDTVTDAVLARVDAELAQVPVKN